MVDIKDVRQQLKASFSQVHLNKLKNLITLKITKDERSLDNYKLALEELVDYASTDIQKRMIVGFLIELICRSNALGLIAFNGRNV